MTTPTGNIDNNETVILIPCYNEADCLPATFASLDSFLAQHANVSVTFIDDKSTDETIALLQDYQKTSQHNGRITILSHDQNRGKGASIKTGIEHTAADVACFTDADLTYHLANIIHFRDQLQPGQFLIADRMHPDSLCNIKPSIISYIYFRHILSRTYNLLVRLVLLPFTHDIQAGLKMGYTKDFKSALRQGKESRFCFDVELVANLHFDGKKIRCLPVSYNYLSNTTNVSVIRDGLSLLMSLARLSYKRSTGGFR